MLYLSAAFLADLQTLSRQATQGRWWAEYGDVWIEGGIGHVAKCSVGLEPGGAVENAAHIAAFDPPTCQALLDLATRGERAEAMVAELESDKKLLYAEIDILRTALDEIYGANVYQTDDRYSVMERVREMAEEALAKADQGADDG